MKIINSIDSAITKGYWHNPGADFYNKICSNKEALKEAYLVIGEDAGENVPFTRSGCKYPHHSINKDGDLVLNVAGVKAAYQRAKQMGIFSGEVKEHLMRHYKELDIYKGSQMESDKKITENFEYIESVLGIDENKYFMEWEENSSIDELSEWIDNVAHNGFDEYTKDEYDLSGYSYRVGINYDTGNKVAVQFVKESDTNIDNEYPFNGKDLYVVSIFDEHGNLFDKCRMIPITSKPLKIWDTLIENYYVGESGGDEVYKSHALIWDPVLDSSLITESVNEKINKDMKFHVVESTDPEDYLYRKYDNYYTELEKCKKDNNNNYFSMFDHALWHYISECELELANTIALIESMEKINNRNIFSDKLPIDMDIVLEKYNEAHKTWRKRSSGEIEWSIYKADPGIENIWFVRSNDNVVNCCLSVKGYDKPMRGRSSMICLKQEDDTIYIMAKHNTDDYNVPGGGWNKDEFPEDAAKRELHEEARCKVHRVKRFGTLIEYDSTVQKWVKEHVPEKDWWYGYYSAIFVGKYNGDFKGKVRKRDCETGYKWEKLDKVIDKLPKEYQDAINQYINKFFAEGHLPTDMMNMPVEYEFPEVQDPESLLSAMDTIAYDKSINSWRLKSPEETWSLKLGNCHDQSLLAKWWFDKMGYVSGQLFFIEMNERESTGGNAHTLTSYIDNKKYYWFEHSWENKRGIHGPYNSIDELKEDVYREWKSDDDINSHKYKRIEFFDIPKYKLGMTLGEYVKSWVKGINESTDIMNMFIEADDSNEEQTEEGTPTTDEPPALDETPAEEPTEETLQEEPNEEPPSLDEEPAEEPQQEEQKEVETKEEEPKKEEKPLSMPKQTDAAEKGKNGVNRKKLYIAFIEWCKEYNSKNTFGSIFDKDIFHNVYPFVPEELRYFYRLANPILCVLAGDLTFFQVSELKMINKNNPNINEMIIFAATNNDLRVFNNKDKKVYLATEENGIKLGQVLGESFDLYIQNMIKKGDILNTPLENSNEE